MSGRRILLASDLHIYQETASICLQILTELLDEARRFDTDQIALLGDIHHTRGLVLVWLQNAFLDWLDLAASRGIRVRMIPGNHDQINVQGRHALEPFRDHPAVRLYDEPTADEDGYWIPYHPDFEGQVADSISWARAQNQRVIFAHLPIVGALMNNTLPCSAGVPLEAFEGFQHVLLGHFHKPQHFTVGPTQVDYLGSPYEVRSDEHGQPKGFALWDGERLHREVRAWGPRHFKITAADVPAALTLLEFQGAKAHDRITVLLPEGSLEQAAPILEKEYPHLVLAPSDVRVASARPLPDRPLGLRDHAVRYVCDRRQGLDAEMLMSVFDNLTEKHPG